MAKISVRYSETLEQPCAGEHFELTYNEIIWAELLAEDMKSNTVLTLMRNAVKRSLMAQWVNRKNEFTLSVSSIFVDASTKIPRTKFIILLSHKKDRCKNLSLEFAV